MKTLMSSLNSQKVAAGTIAERPSALALNLEDGAAPKWVMLWPQGRLVVGRDKREFVIHDPEAIIGATRPRLPLLVDYEHDFERRRPGDETPAAGWIEELEVRDGAIWGRVEWTAKASNAIAEKEYRFHSPIYLCRQKTAPLEVVALCGAGLTHAPNLDFTALNSEQDDIMEKDLLKALGLPETATAAEAIMAANALRTPSLDKFVPRAELDAALTRATNAETRLRDRDQADADSAALALVEKAIADGKVAPASKEHFLELAKNSRETVEKYLESAPAILTPGEDKDLKKGEPGKGGALSAEEKAMCSQLSISEEQFIKARG